jgi:hypothetical protein
MRRGINVGQALVLNNPLIQTRGSGAGDSTSVECLLSTTLIQTHRGGGRDSTSVECLFSITPADEEGNATLRGRRGLKVGRVLLLKTPPAVANNVPSEHCPARASRDDSGSSPRRAACSCRGSLCEFRPRSTSERAKMSASMAGSQGR